MLGIDPTELADSGFDATAKIPDKALVDKYADELSVNARDTRPYQMTIMEKLFYKPASQLKSGEHNFVSLPGRACYG